MTMTSLTQSMAELVSHVAQNNTWRQRLCVNLIPSENTPSLLVRLLEICDPAGRYAEHRTISGVESGYYQGTDFIIHHVEERLREELANFLQCEQVEVRPISGQMANEALFKAMVRYLNRSAEGKARAPHRRIGCVVSNDLIHGGHLSSQPFGALFNYVEVDTSTGHERVLSFPVLSHNPYRIDAAAACDLITAKKPDLVIFGKSMVLCREPVRDIATAITVAGLGTVIEYDMAHTLALYGAFQAPFEEGAHFVTGSTHKTFWGPQRGLIATSIGKDHPKARLWLDLRDRVFPGSTSNHHLGTLLGLLGAVLEMKAYKAEYQSKVISNAQAFARALARAGLLVEGEEEASYTETHQVILRVGKDGTGEEVARRLEHNNIIVNYQALPGDLAFERVSGLRLGVSEMTRFGMEEDDFGTLAGLIAEVVLGESDVRSRVEEFRSAFLSMCYCMGPREAGTLAAELISTSLPDRALVDALRLGLEQIRHVPAS
jgi:glycine/serine hydroxymethyltransferase